MITKSNKYLTIMVLLGLLSCKKKDSDSELIFSRICDFSGSKVEVVNELSGTLRYTDNILDYPIGSCVSGCPTFSGEPVFVIRSPGQLLQIVVCNMPAEFEMEKDVPRNVTFGGRILMLPDNVDALNTDIELNYLKFE